MSDRAGPANEYFGIRVIGKPSQWPHVRSRRKSAATRPPLLSTLTLIPPRAQSLVLPQPQHKALYSLNQLLAR